MRAITVKQPWSTAIASGAKRVENRGRRSPWHRVVGQRIAIHAGKGWDREAIKFPPMLSLIQQITERQWQEQHPEATGMPTAMMLPLMIQEGHHLGAILATTVLTDVHDAERCDGRCGPWASRATGTWHLQLNDTQLLVGGPIPCAGALGLWRLPEQVERELLSRRTVPAPLGSSSVAGPRRGSAAGHRIPSQVAVR